MFDVSVTEEQDGFVVLAHNKTSRSRIPLRGFCSYENVRRIQEAKPGADPVAEITAVMLKSLELWQAKGLI
jgi:hypothetical protein